MRNVHFNRGNMEETAERHARWYMESMDSFTFRNLGAESLIRWATDDVANMAEFLSETGGFDGFLISVYANAVSSAIVRLHGAAIAGPRE